MAVPSKLEVVTQTPLGGDDLWRPMKTSKGGEEEEKKSPQLDIWDSIQTLNKDNNKDLFTPYVHPLVKSSKNSMSQRSLEVCTENLGSETGSDGYSDLVDFFSSSSSSTNGYERVHVKQNEDLEGEGEEELCRSVKRRELAAVNYHCSIGRRALPRSFPPPLPSISRRDGPCVQMRSRKENGRLVLEAVPVPSQNYLHWRREGGRLLLSFIETTFEEIYPCDARNSSSVEQEQLFQQEHKEEEDVHEDVVERKDEVVDEEEDDEDDDDEEEAEEEVEVVDRGIVIEVKLSSREPLPQSMKLKGHRPSLVINKFVGSAPLCNNEADGKVIESSRAEAKKLDSPSETASNSLEFDGWGCGRRELSNNQHHHENKMFFTFKRLMNRQALLHQVRRCSYQHGPLFIWEPCYVASS